MSDFIGIAVVIAAVILIGLGRSAADGSFDTEDGRPAWASVVWGLGAILFAVIIIARANR